MQTQTITLDVLNKTPSNPIICRYGEKGRVIRFEIMNSETDDKINLSGYSVSFQVFKPDGNFVIDDNPTVSNTHVDVTISEQMTTAPGNGYVDLKLTKTGELVYTCHAQIVVDTPVSNDDVVASVSLVNGLVFPDDFQEKLKAGVGIYFTDNGRTINARASGYSEGMGISISEENVISISEELETEIEGKQNVLTPGNGISISEDNVISATLEGLKYFDISGTTNSYGSSGLFSQYANTPSDFLPAYTVSAVSKTPNTTPFIFPSDDGTDRYFTLYNGVPNAMSNTDYSVRVWFVPVELEAHENHVE